VEPTAKFGSVHPAKLISHLATVLVDETGQVAFVEVQQKTGDERNWAPVQEALENLKRGNAAGGMAGGIELGSFLRRTPVLQQPGTLGGARLRASVVPPDFSPWVSASFGMFSSSRGCSRASPPPSPRS